MTKIISVSDKPSRSCMKKRPGGRSLGQCRIRHLRRMAAELNPMKPVLIPTWALGIVREYLAPCPWAPELVTAHRPQFAMWRSELITQQPHRRTGAMTAINDTSADVARGRFWIGRYDATKFDPVSGGAMDNQWYGHDWQLSPYEQNDMIEGYGTGCLQWKTYSIPMLD